MSTLRILKTIKDFEDAGLDIVAGDKGRGFRFRASNLIETKYCKTSDLVFDSFAYRKNTGVKPEFTGGILARLRNGSEVIVYTNNNWELTGSELNIIEWKPALIQVAQQLHHEAESNIESIKESNEAMKKPVYTKEMHDNGERPPVGSKCLALFIDSEDAHSWFNVKILMHNGNVSAACYLTDDELFDGKNLLWSADFKPLDTRTDEEKLRDAWIGALSPLLMQSLSGAALDLLIQSNKFTITLKE